MGSLTVALQNQALNVYCAGLNTCQHSSPVVCLYMCSLTYLTLQALGPSKWDPKP